MEKEWVSFNTELKKRASISSRIACIKAVAKAKRELSNMCECLERDTMKDLTLIPVMYKKYDELLRRFQFRGDVRNGNKKQFVYAVFLLYSPEAIFGGRIDKELRIAIRDVLGLKSDSGVYQMRDKARIWYETYPVFASEVRIAYEAIAVF